MRILLFLMFLSGFSALSQDVARPPDIVPPDTVPIVFAEMWSHCTCGRDAHYKGGKAAMSAFINKNISFSDEVVWGDIEYVRAYVQFVVEKDGSLSDIHVIHTNFQDIDEYIVSVFRRMTNWVGAKYGCGAARTRVRVPISLVLR